MTSFFFYLAIYFIHFLIISWFRSYSGDLSRLLTDSTATLLLVFLLNGILLAQSSSEPSDEYEFIESVTVAKLKFLGFRFVDVSKVALPTVVNF